MDSSGVLKSLVPTLFDKQVRWEGPGIEPVVHFRLDPDYAGAWVVAADVDGDGQAEIISARNVNVDDVHYTSSVVAHRLDGSVLWRWGDPTIGRSLLHHDVACQIHDWDGDGKPEVILLGESALIALDGLTGQEKTRFPIPPHASDCLVFADLAGRGWPSEVLVKTRYGQMWAFNNAGRLLWTVEKPGGYLTAHQPLPIDIDGDGRDEVLAGYALLNPDGSIRWTLNEHEIDIGRGHLDCARSLHSEAPAGQDLVMTLCAAGALLCAGPEGQVRWSQTGLHYESIDVGKTIPGQEDRQIVVDIDHNAPGEDSPVLIFSDSGKLLGRYNTPYSRFHLTVDWEGRGYDAILLGQVRTLCDGTGQVIARLGAVLEPDREAALSVNAPLEYMCASGNILGRGDGDIVIFTNPSSDVWVFCNPERIKTTPAPLGFGLNFTLY
jgi:hypothetical protein